MLTFGFNILAEHLFCAKNNQRLTFVFYTLVETNDISEPILWQFVCSQESRYANIFLLVRLVSVCHRPVFLWKQKWRQKSDWMEVLCLVYTFVFSPEPNRNSLTQDIFLKSKLGPSNKIITYNWLKTYNTNIRWMFIFEVGRYKWMS